MLLTRIVVLIFVTLLVACGVCAALFPLMRRRGTTNGHAWRTAVYLWYEEVTYTIGKNHYSTRAYHHHGKCDGFRIAAVLAAALDATACILGAIVCLLAAAHLYARTKFSICCSIMVLCLVTFASFAVSVAAIVFLFRADFCVNDETKRMLALRDEGYTLEEGFIFLCVAAGGFLVAVFVEIFS
ncbi:hypothetical protein CUR178_05639 [Leishmania enriettii]|uniref:Amastin-like protein n=1 Tax=Leishmania enriettii TaxID=5663 RepID=A0A836H0H6_LEIEN|nr:hypothetical protein CUR178_05639 [Leishmania enriettii]